MPQPSNNILSSIFCTILLGIGLTNCQSDSAVVALPDQVDFNFHIRPILSNHCFTCHGPDISGRQADLRLDTYEGATALLETGNRAIDPDHWRNSALIKRIESTDPEITMPPPEANNPLSERDIALLKKWIKQGAEWKPYWAFVAPDKDRYDPTESIDDFIQQELETQGLESVPQADKRSLIRRLSYLLTGLPPAPEFVNEYLTNESEDAYEQLVDKLLASPHFGERWARHWMDLVRYAETMGHEFDYPIIGAWRYRDYLIRTFNADVPYDQFVKEQLAGDLLENQRFDAKTGTNESLLATAFYTLGEGKHSPVDIKQEELDHIDNMIDVTTKTFQSLTLACARCHDHKFDPLPTTDYYALYGIFESTRFAYYPVNSGLTQMAQIDSITAHKKALRQLIAGSLDKPQATALTISQQFAPEEDTLSNRQILADFRQGDLQGWITTGPAFSNGNALGAPTFNTKQNRLEGFAYGAASSRSTGEGIQGTLSSPTFQLDQDFITVRAAGVNSTIRIIIDNFQLIQNPIYGELAKEVNAPEIRDYVFNLGMWRGHKAYIELLPGIKRKARQNHHFSIAADAWLAAEYAFMHSQKEVSPLTPIQLSDTTTPQTQDIQDWIAGQPKPETVAYLNKQLSQGRIPRQHLDFVKHLDAIQQLKDSVYVSDAFAGMSEGDAIFSPVFIRGSHQELSKEIVPHRYLTAFAETVDPFPEKGSGRLALAEAIAHPDNPLTARVMVNRIWHHLFGRGLVETVDNFGLQGKIPSHPALLDHLALRFIEQGWSIKKLIKEIVLSETFRASSENCENCETKDPQNIYLAHFPVRRLEAEAIRDGILAVSGQLDSTLFGPSIPVHLTEFMQGRGRPRGSGPLDGAGRRSIYQAIRRNFLAPMMLTFDQPVPFSSFGRRNVTNVPAQSLNLLNDPFVQEQAKLWAERLLQEEMFVEDGVATIFQTAFSRSPSDSEVKQAQTFFQEQGRLMNLSTEEARLNQSIWADYCQVIFNNKEFIFLM